MRESALGRARRAKQAASRVAWREAVLERDSYLCRLIGVTLPSGPHGCEGRLHAHHVLPRSHGGRDELGNGLTLCDRGHRYVHELPAWAYREGYLLRSGVA